MSSRTCWWGVHTQTSVKNGRPNLVSAYFTKRSCCSTIWVWRWTSSWSKRTSASKSTSHVSFRSLVFRSRASSSRCRTFCSKDIGQTLRMRWLFRWKFNKGKNSLEYRKHCQRMMINRLQQKLRHQRRKMQKIIQKLPKERGRRKQIQRVRASCNKDQPQQQQERDQSHFQYLTTPALKR